MIESELPEVAHLRPSKWDTLHQFVDAVPIHMKVRAVQLRAMAGEQTIRSRDEDATSTNDLLTELIEIATWVRHMFDDFE